MKSKSLWNWLKVARIEDRPIHIIRIENGAGSGLPDVNGWHPEFGEFWIELKTEGDARRPSQEAWRRLRERAGARNIFHLHSNKGVKRITGYYGARIVENRTELWHFIRESVIRCKLNQSGGI